MLRKQKEVDDWTVGGCKSSPNEIRQMLRTNMKALIYGLWPRTFEIKDLDCQI